jgi:hypothetical protein
MKELSEDKGTIGDEDAGDEDCCIALDLDRVITLSCIG